MHVTWRDIDSASRKDFDMSHRNARARSVGGIALAASMTLAAGGASAAEQAGQVRSGDIPVSYALVQLFQAGTSAGGGARQLGKARADGAGAFRITYDEPPTGSVLYLVASGGAVGNRPRSPVTGPIRLAAALGAGQVPARVTINERTTVAFAYAYNQFLDGRTAAGVAPGPANAAMMAHNLADIASGDLATVVATAPNGTETQTMGQFNSLANLLSACARSPDSAQCRRLLQLATPPGGETPGDTLQATLNIARHPANNAKPLFRLSGREASYRPVLSKAPATWTLALRFVGDGKSFDGPGNVAFDPDGNVYIINNYTYGATPFSKVCGGRKLFVLDPSGKPAPTSPFTGGGLDGAGYGITFDPDGKLWAASFGFAGSTCNRPPRDRSVSKFDIDGTPLSPPAGFRQGDIKKPQGMASDRDGNIWVANCGNNSATLYPGGNPAQARNFSDIRLLKPFGLVTDADGNVWIAGNQSNQVIRLDPDGNVTFRTPAGSGVRKPIGLALDSLGNVWIANSGVINIPCHPGDNYLRIPKVSNASVMMITPDGVISERFTGGGAVRPWGIAVDGNDTVWVANFGQKRVSQLCGAKPENCPPGAKTGDAISPPGGYAFDGLQRNTSVQIDPSGNVWITNNWRNAPIQVNPGGQHMVVLIGMAAPLKTPLIGPPQRP